MFSSPMKTRFTPARAHFSMKFGSLWQSVSTWMMKLDLDPFSSSRSSISRSRIASQSVLRAKLSSVMKKLCSPCATFSRTICSMSSGERRRDLRPCTLMIVQNEHWNGTAAAGVEARHARRRCVARAQRGDQRHRRALDAGQVVHVVVERLERAGVRVAQHLVEPPFGLAGEERDAQRLRAFERPGRRR